jgi:hypothetical protein
LAEDFYEPPRKELSQGDVLEFLPNVQLDYPLQLLEIQTDNSFRSCDFSAGDETKTRALARCRIAMAILLTHDCEIDKPHVKNWVVNPVVPISEIPGTAHSDLRKNKILNLVHLSPYRDVLPESVIVLGYTTTLAREFIDPSRRIVSLSDTGRHALYGQYIRWLTRWKLSELRCPNCGVEFNAAAGMKVRS